MNYIHVKGYSSDFIQLEENNKLKLQPVIIDFVGEKHIAPYLEKYVQINYITQELIVVNPEYSHKKLLLESEIVIFDRYYFRSRKEVVTYSKWPKNGISYFDKNDFFNRINKINEFIDMGGDIRLIKVQNFMNFDLTIDIPIDRLISLTSKFEIKYFENSRTKVKKDDLSWNEAEIRNVSIKDEYLLSLLIKSFKKISWHFSETKYGFLLEFNYGESNEEIRHHERKECEEDYKIEERILSCMIENYDKTEHSFQILTSNNKLWD